MPSISRNPPTAMSTNSQVAPWASTPNGANMANNAWGSFFNDSSEDVAQLSPGFGRPGTGSREDSMGFPLKDDRRPSVASATTVSSTGSKSSIRTGGFHKRLQNVFGEDFPADGRQNSQTSLNGPYATETQSLRGYRNRGNSLNNTGGGSGSYHSRPASPSSSRPRTPQPSSEVTPWEFQEPKVCHLYFPFVDYSSLPRPLPTCYNTSSPRSACGSIMWTHYTLLSHLGGQPAG